MVAAVRTLYPAGTNTVTQAGGTTTITTASVAVQAGDSVLIVVILNDGDTTGQTISATFSSQGSDDASVMVASNNSTSGEQRLFYWRNPGAVTASAVATITGGTAPDVLMMKVYVISGSDQAQPVFTNNVPSGVVAAVSVTTVSVADGLVIGAFISGSAFSSVNNTQTLIFQHGAQTWGANSVAGNSAPGTGSNITLTGNHTDDWCAGTAVSIAPAATANTGASTGAVGWAGSATGQNVTPPAQVTNLVATRVGDTELDLTWNAVAGALFYEVERDAVVVATSRTNAYNDTGLTAGGVQYCYRVRAGL